MTEPTDMTEDFGPEPTDAHGLPLEDGCCSVGGMAVDLGQPIESENRMAGLGHVDVMTVGLTRLEIFSALAMQGLMANLGEIRREGFKDTDIEEFAVARAIGLMDRLACEPANR